MQGSAERFLGQALFYRTILLKRIINIESGLSYTVGEIYVRLIS